MKLKTAIQLLIIAGLGIVCHSADAQLTVQQPIVEQLRIGTTVSVPDRGGVFIGGVKRARDSRSSFGLGRAPLKPGSSIGFDREFTGVSVHAYIHDFDEMDRMLLEDAERSSSLGGSGLGSGLKRYKVSDLASTSMRNRFDRPMSSPAPTLSSRRYASLPPKRTSAASTSGTNEAEKSLELGMAAIKAGRDGVAKLHFRKAAKYGSTRATEMLLELAKRQ